ncbi:unannotated protein [freshwater metagenome]|uniref:Unannotated protein n=1 Tax=freshwater metagenome TaxID=449393 RepID=A0A6J6TM28_9ZZZZ
MVSTTDPEGNTFPIEDHFVNRLGLALSFDGSGSAGVAEIPPEAFVPGTTRLRTAYLATLVDMVAGHAPTGGVGPTVDLRVQLLSSPPSGGTIRLACSPLRVGRRLIVAQTLLYSQEHPTPFATATTTFINKYVGGNLDAMPPPAPAVEESLDAFIGARVRDDRSMELTSRARIANGLNGTVQGGVQALLAEMTAEHLLGGGAHMAALDLDIRYLGSVRTGPLVATVVSSPAIHPFAMVHLTDGATGDLVSHVSLTMEYVA